ncbi:hypothetical protein LPJ61_006652 [Coemansia biformis]|uniref:Uncharacterized protein n=1 Tax=Coemansia biformis TaxID=1286918 RepID=A0A9W8CP19_9FUNG|nr:hypothetical protein LPJ61_006652 [Coemansia biformis]
MLGFIRRLPNLTGLTFYQLELGDVQSDITVSEASGHTPIEPYDTKIKGLAVNYNREQHSPEQAVAVSKHLLLKIPTLTRFLAAQTPKQPVMEFAATFVQWYPHLDNVGFKLYEGEESASVRWCSQALL